jgi:2-acylglycerol O-acyltransferase 2
VVHTDKKLCIILVLMKAFSSFPNWMSSPTLWRWFAYGIYSLSGLYACKSFGFLRGRGTSSPLGLIAVRAFFFSLAWIPTFMVSKILALGWLVYLPFYCDLSEYNGWRISSTFRRSIAGHIFQTIFKCRLVPTSKIESQCIMAVHPHGIIPFASITNLASDVTGFATLYPALAEKRVVIAATSCFLVPGYRDILVSSGVLDCSRFNAEQCLQKGWTVIVIPGGAREALYSNPDVDWLDLKRKLGFVRLAIRYGVKLVPCYSFNEVDYLSQVPLSSVPAFFQYLRRGFQQTFGISIPFLYHVDLPPSNENGIVTVIGEPITVPHIADPTDDEVREVMTKYIAELTKLYHTYGPMYNSRTRRLVIS